MWTSSECSALADVVDRIIDSTRNLEDAGSMLNERMLEACSRCASRLTAVCDYENQSGGFLPLGALVANTACKMVSSRFFL